jgi:pilus assembly protein CpaB
MKEKIILLLSVLIGLAAFYLTNRYLNNERQKLMAGVERVKIVVAGRDLPSRTVLKKDDLATRDEIKSAVGDNFVSPEEYYKILDKQLLFPLKLGAPILWSQVEAAERTRRGLSSTIKVGMRAVSIAVSGAETVSGLIQPSDHVDILGTFTFPSRRQAGETEAVTLTMLQDVTILATGTRLGRQGAYGSDTWSQQAGGFSTISLEVTPREAEMLTFAQHVKGQLVLALRNEDDVSFEKALPEVNFEMIEKNLPELNTYRQLKIRNKKNL